MRATIPVLALLLAAACGGEDDGRGEIPDVPVEAVDETGRLILSPAESAAAARAVEAHARRVGDSVRAAAGLPAEEAPAPSATPPPVPRGYAGCMAQAAEAESAEERAVLEGICRRLPGAP